MFKCVKEDYPKMFHIRDTVNILVDVFNADEIKIYESFSAVEPYYINEMKENIETVSRDNNIENINKDNNKDNIESVSKDNNTQNIEKFKLLENYRDNIYNIFTQNIVERLKLEKTQE